MEPNSVPASALDNLGALDNLRDIHLPEAVSWWPLALGWWLLFGACVAVSLGLVLRRWLKRRVPAVLPNVTPTLPWLDVLSLASDELAKIRRQHAAGGQTLQNTAMAVSILMRRVALHHPQATQDKHNKVAGLTGEAWLQWLNRHPQQNEAIFSPQMALLLTEVAYRPTLSNVANEEAEALFEACQRWLKGQEAYTCH